MKKFGMYFLLIAITLAIGMASYISERNKLRDRNEKKQEEVYEPVAVVSTPKPAPTATATTVLPRETEKASAPEEEKEIDSLRLPTDGAATKDFYNTVLCYSETMKDFRTHSGIDFEGEEGAVVYASADGTVKAVYEDDFLGLTVSIEHGSGLETLYCSLSDCSVSEGESVQCGDEIGTCGNSAKSESAEGVHLHFEVKKDGNTVNPQDYFK